MRQQENIQTDVATGASYGAIANKEHAKIAVQNAIKKMQPNTISSVLLFLSYGYAHKPQEAITEAAKAAGTPQIFGCCAMSLLSEEEWLLDVEGAVAMVFPNHLSLQPLQVMANLNIEPNLALNFTTPNAATIAVNSSKIPQIGSIATDEYGHGPFSVWQSGRIVEREFSHNAFNPELKGITKIADGIRQLSPVMRVTKAKNHRLMEINDTNALGQLLSSLPDNIQSIGLEQPYNLLCALSENEQLDSIKQGHFKLQHIVANDEDHGHLHLSGSVKENHHMFWAIRDENAAEETILKKLSESKDELEKLGKSAEFCLMFPNISRGPAFYNGRDRDLELYRQVFPNVPMIGFYGNGEIAPGHKLAGLIHRYSTVFSIFYK